MSSFQLERETVVEYPIEEVFEFFGDPSNLEAITPPWLRFRMVQCAPGPLCQGSLIRYRLRLRGIPISWTSRISRWEPPFAFVDEQLRGPYTSWVHTHTFEDLGGRTRMRDHVAYSVPGGALVDRLLVRRDLERVFDYREEKLQALLRRSA